jgi:hypothetical protein
MVKCNMDLEPSDLSFQVTTNVKLPQHPPQVAFYAVRNQSDFAKAGSVIPYEHLMTNVGKAMTKEGIFTAPLKGVYFFAFSFMTNVQNEQVAVRLRVNNGSMIATVVVHDGYRSSSSSPDWIPGSAHMSVALSKGDIVDTFLATGRLLVSSLPHWTTHFTGFLLYPL